MAGRAGRYTGRILVPTSLTILACALVGVHVAAQPASSTSFTISGQSMVTGGSASASTSYRLLGCIDYNPGGFAESPSYRIHSGCGVAFLPLPAASVSGDTGICAGDSAELTLTLGFGSPPWSAVVNGTSYPLTQATENITVTPATTTVYTIGSITAGGFTTLAGGSGSATVTVDASGDCDGDGVGDGSEDGVNPQQDGNGDTIRDAIQADVTSLQRPDGGWITVEIVGGGCGQLQNVATYTEATASGGGFDGNFDYPYGLVGFELPDCSSATVRVHYHGVTTLADMIYRKYGITWWAGSAPGPIGWYLLEPQPTFGISIGGVPYAEFTLNDNTLGDDSAVVRFIADQGGVATSLPIPALETPGLLALLLLIGIAGALVSRRGGAPGA